MTYYWDLGSPARALGQRASGRHGLFSAQDNARRTLETGVTNVEISARRTTRTSRCGT
jgi:hypothetical protein